MLNGKKYFSTYPLVEISGLLAYKNIKNWIVEEPYDLVPNYISPFELGNR